MEKYAALLRGINVGGSNVIKMEELKVAFEEMKFADVRTYIASGNVIFSSMEANKAKLTGFIEKKLLGKLKTEIRLALVSFAELKQIVEQAPKGFGKEKDRRYDVWFLMEGLASEEVLQAVKPKEGVDTMAGGQGVVYASRLISLAGRSHLIRVNKMPVYQNITVRSWNTAQKLLGLMGN